MNLMNLMNLMAPDRGISVVVVREFQHALYRDSAMIAKRRNVGSWISNGCYAGTFGGAGVRLTRRHQDSFRRLSMVAFLLSFNETHTLCCSFRMRIEPSSLPAQLTQFSVASRASTQLGSLLDPSTMGTQIERLYKMRPTPAQPMADGSDHATRLPPEILIRTFCLIPDDATACMKTCKTFKDPAINVHWRKFNNQRFENLLDMNDKKIKASYMAHVRDLVIKLPEYWHDLPDWFPSSTTQPKNKYYNACTRRDGKAINISHLITPKLKSFELVEFNTRHFVLALCQVTGLETLRFKPLSDSYMEFLPIVSCSPALKTLELMTESVVKTRSSLLLHNTPASRTLLSLIHSTST